MSDYYEERQREGDKDDDPQWDEYQAYFEEQQETVRLEGRDYLALFVASLQTIFLPLIIMIIVFFVIGLFLFLFI
ncbi:MAG: hypothetical protein ACXADC_09150 [Candidatus Thorarchaeota archaeon]